MTRAPDFSQPVLGFRLWTLSKEGVLGPVAWNGGWARGANRAVCHAKRHFAPVQHCGCGLYGLFDDGSERFRYRDCDSGHALGAIAGWGEIEVHPDGFRAQYACVTALSYPPNASASHLAKLERAGERYGVELVLRKRLREAGLEHAQSLPAPKPRKSSSSRKRRVVRRRGSRRRLPVPNTAPSPPEPPPAEGIWLKGHLTVTRKPGAVQLSLTPSLASLLDVDATALGVAEGSSVDEGDAIALIRSGEDRLMIRTPVVGRIESTNSSLATAQTDGSRQPGVPIAVINCGEAQIDPAPIVWGRHGKAAYKSYLRSLQDDRGVLDSLEPERHLRFAVVDSWKDLSRLMRERRREARNPLPDCASVAALAPLLSSWIAEDEHLRSGLASLGIALRFRISDRNVELVVRTGGVARPAVSADPPGSAASLTLTMSADQLHDYLCGELDLAPALGVDVALEGSRLNAILATSLMQRLFPMYRQHQAAIESERQRALGAA